MIRSAFPMIEACMRAQAPPITPVACLDCGGDTIEPYRGLPRCATCAVKRDAA